MGFLDSFSPNLGAQANDPSTLSANSTPADGYGTMFSKLEQERGLPAGFLNGAVQIESSGGTNNGAPGARYQGPFQMGPDERATYGVQNPNDMAQSARGSADLAASNMAYLSREDRLGRAPTASELYLAHQQGPNGAYKLLSNPDVPAGQLVSPAAIRNNGGDPSLPASAFTQKWSDNFARRVGGSTTSPTGGMVDPKALADSWNPTDSGTNSKPGWNDTNVGGSLLTAPLVRPGVAPTMAGGGPLSARSASSSPGVMSAVQNALNAPSTPQKQSPLDRIASAMKPSSAQDPQMPPIQGVNLSQLSMQRQQEISQRAAALMAMLTAAKRIG